MYGHTPTRTHARARTHTHTYIHIYIYIYIYIKRERDTGLLSNPYLRVNPSVVTHTHIHIYIHIYMHMYLYIPAGCLGARRRKGSPRPGSAGRRSGWTSWGCSLAECTCRTTRSTRPTRRRCARCAGAGWRRRWRARASPSLRRTSVDRKETRVDIGDASLCSKEVPSWKKSVNRSARCCEWSFRRT